MVKKIIAAASIFILAACTANSTETDNKKAQIIGGKGNPASVNCIEKGGKSVTLKERDGGEFSMCEFPNGKKCEEWALFRGECSAK